MPHYPAARPFWAAAFSLLILLGLGACSRSGGANAPMHPDTARYRNIEPERVVLLAFQSYDTEDVLRNKLTGEGYVIKSTLLAKAKSGRYPPRDMLSLQVEHYRHLGETGTLTLELFNNRLMEADFRPDDPNAYAKVLHREIPDLKRDQTGIAVLVSENLRIFSNVDLAKSRVGGSLGTDALVLWQDRRLIAQRNEWDERFGSIPEPVK